MADSNPDEPIVDALVRRFERDQDEPWKRNALEIACKFRELIGRRDAIDIHALREELDKAARLPPDADGLRETLWGWCSSAEVQTGTIEFQHRAVAAGALVIGPHGHLAIVEGPTGRPSEKWLAEQETPLRASDGPYWSALVLTGGAIIVTEPDVYVVGEPDDAQLELALEMGNVAAAKELVRLFPNLINLIARR